MRRREIGTVMSNIVAAEFEGFEAAQAARRALREGFAPSRTSMFYLNPGGQHASFPIGGDQYADPQTKGAGKGALAGAALGGVAGLALGIAVTPILGPLVVGGLAAGAYAGSLAGAVGRRGKRETRPEPPANRPAGVVVAAFAPTVAEREHATSVLERHGPRAIEHAEGIWKDGTWADFDPVSIPKWRKPPAADREARRSGT
jgi:hypothetical protein